VRTKVKTPGAGKNEERLQVPSMEKLCKLHYFPVQGSCLVLNRNAARPQKLRGGELTLDTLAPDQAGDRQSGMSSSQHSTAQTSGQDSDCGANSTGWGDGAAAWLWVAGSVPESMRAQMPQARAQPS
jgi:hypothetical protein